MYGDEKYESASGNQPNGLGCAEFEAWLTDALDGVLSGERLQAFEAHRASCPDCGPMYAAAEEGLHWLRDLKDEVVEPPARVMDDILRATSRAYLPQGQIERSWWQRLSGWSVLAPVLQTVRQPRFAMSFAMAFCSLSVLLTVLGVTPRDLRRLDLRPSAVVRNVAVAGGKVQKYYDNVKLVYEIESRVRDLKRATTPEEPDSGDSKQQKQKTNRIGRPQGDEHRDYSLETGTVQLVKAQGSIRREKGIWL
jgi:hypothetical protein